MPPPIISLRNNPAAAIRAACLDKGFLYIIDHGVDPDLLAAIFTQARRFFALPDAAKAQVDMRRSPQNRGYEPLRGQILQAGTPPDLKEGFYTGRELPPDDPRVLAGLFGHGPNQWPANLPGFRDVLETYFTRMEALNRTVMRLLAQALDLPATYFDPFCEDAVCNLKLLHYPPMPPNPHPDEKGCGAHTDWGALTFLAQDDVGGLQVWDAASGWTDAPPVPNAFVVNLGDLIARWTNGRFASTLHRVINRSGRERYAVPFFFTGRPDHKIACLPGCLAPGETPKYAPTTAIGHLQKMYEQSYKA